MPLIDGIINGLGKVVGLIDDVVTSDEERMQLRVPLLELQNQITTQLIQYERDVINRRADVVIAEATSESWLTRTWRPIMMLTFGFILIMTGFGWMDPDFFARLPDRMWTLLTTGIGGYIVAREVGKYQKNKGQADG